jgi:integrase
VVAVFTFSERVSPSGAKTFVAVARDPNGKQVWHTIGNTAEYTLDEARTLAPQATRAIKAGADRAGPQSFQAVAADWVKRRLEARGVITLKNRVRYLENHILPAWGGRDFRSIKRSDVAKLMDGVEDTAGPTAADEVLSIVRSICRWYSSRNDDYAIPIAPNMRRTSAKERARDRVLTDDEIRSIWASQAVTPMLPIVKLLLLTGQRRTTVASMRWDDVSIDGTWHIPNGNKRMKGTGGELVLPPMAIDIIRAQPRFAYSLYVFPAARAKGHFKAYTDGKLQLDKAASKGAEIQPWRLHDLRRTARSLMSRAGVRPEVAERVLGHAMGGVEGIYDRHSYRNEKAQALNALAGLVETILRGPVENVVALVG